jgi:protein SDA1
LNDLRAEGISKASGNGSSQTKRKHAERHSDDRDESNIVSENDILGPRKKAKADYAERIASIQKGREGREKFGSQKGKQKKEVASSSTNREKARNKPIMMILSSGAVRSKKKASLRQKQQKLRAHIERAKKARR